jgi:hypothetical protein
LAPTVGIAATGFCYPDGILQLFHRQDQQVFHRQDQQIFHRQDQQIIADADSSSQIASTYPSTFIDSQIAYGYLIYFNDVKLVIIVGKIFIANTNRLASFVIDT